MLLDPVKDDSGYFVDSAGNQATLFFVSLLDNTGFDYTLLFGSNSDYPFSTGILFARFNIVCQKAPEVTGKFKFVIFMHYCIPQFEINCIYFII